jgi:hypothetical protein
MFIRPPLGLPVVQIPEIGPDVGTGSLAKLGDANEIVVAVARKAAIKLPFQL